MPLSVLGPHRSAQSVQDFALYDIGGGVNIKASPQEVNDNELTAGTNVYLRTDGGLDMRKGLVKRSTSLGAVGIIGMARLFQMVVNGVVKNPSTKFLLAQVGGTLWNVDTATQIGATNALGIGALPWSTARVYDPNHAGGASDVLVICTGVGGPYYFDGTSIVVPTAWSTNVPSARWVQLVNGVLWFGGIPSQPNLVWGSALGSPETIPVYNSFALSRPVTGLGAIGAGAQAALVAGHDLGLTVISGVGPSNFVEQEVPSEDGPAAGRTMVTVDGVLYYLGDNAIYRYDGASNVAISDNIEPWILNDPLHPEYPMNGNRPLNSWALYYNRRIYFFYDSGPAGYPNTGVVWDLRRSGWTVYRGLPLGAGCMLNAPDDADPPLAVVGNATTGQAYAFEVAIGGGGLANDNVSDDGAAIAATATTKFFKLGLPGTPKRLLRVYPELFTETYGGTISVVTDYGNNASSQIVVNVSIVGGMWDVSNWDQGFWSAGGLAYVKPRTDFNLEGEAFAFTISTSDTNPPWRWMGLTGTFSQGGKR